MAFDWVHYITLAERLKDAAETLNDEGEPDFQQACLRSAISRAYYGVFCMARNLLLKKHVEIPREHVHEYVRNRYLAAGDVEVEKVGENLKRLWGKRIQADYDNEMEIKEGKDKSEFETVKKHIKKAHNTATRISGLESQALLSFSED